jgi:tetratricopeptide (TPR) repeat protein
MEISPASVLVIIPFWNNLKKMKKIFVLILAFFICNTATLLAQSEPDDVAAVTDDFQNAFFESLKQKAIENYDKSILSLDKCLKLEPNNAAVLHEMGKNYMFLKDYKNAYESFEKAAIIDPKNKWFLHGMYDVCYQTQDYSQAIAIVLNLVKLDAGYKEDLISLYMKTLQFEKALVLINDLNENIGKSEKRDLFKAQILSEPKNQQTEVENLLMLIKKNPKEEANYNALINLYTKNKQDKEALVITKKLEAEIPNADWSQVSLFKTYLTNNDGAKAVDAMNKVLENDKIDSKIKYGVLKAFVVFTQKNPDFYSYVEKAIGYFKADGEVKVAKEIGRFYQSKKEWDKAILFYERNEKDYPNDLENSLLLLESYSQKQKFELILNKANQLIEIYPLQPQFYYYAGLANNQLNNFKNAKLILEIGIDYVVENKDLEINFNIQLGEAYNGLGDLKKKETYFLKADKLLKQKK